MLLTLAAPAWMPFLPEAWRLPVTVEYKWLVRRLVLGSAIAVLSWAVLLYRNYERENYR